jgi:hypothetical protein
MKPGCAPASLQEILQIGCAQPSGGSRVIAT